MKRMIVVSAALLFLVCLCAGKNLEAASDAGGGRLSNHRGGVSGDPYKTMAKELCESAELPGGSKIAVMPFSYGDKKRSDVGVMVSERLTTRIVKLRKFKVIEREMLENVMQELHLEGTGVVDAETTRKLGKILGVEAIVTGTVMDIEDEKAEINARLIKTDTAEVIDTSSAEVPKFWAEGTAPQNTEPVERKRAVSK